MKRTIQSVANALGYEVHSLSSSVPNRRFRMMERLEINLVLDVGVNAGQYASGLRRSGHKGRMRSYEPLHEAFASLSIKAAHDNAGLSSTALVALRSKPQQSMLQRTVIPVRCFQSSTGTCRTPRIQRMFRKKRSRFVLLTRKYFHP